MVPVLCSLCTRQAVRVITVGHNRISGTKWSDLPVQTLVPFRLGSLPEQHILKYEFHISKVLKFIEIY